MHIQFISAALGRRARLIGIVAVIAALLGIPSTPSSRAAASSPTPSAAASGDPGLVGYWPFELGSADADLSGSGNTAVFGNSMGLTSAVPPTPFANQTALLSSLNPTSYATAPGNNIDTLQQFTIAFWLRVRAFPPDGTAMNLVSLPNKASVEYSQVLIGHHDFAFSVQGADTSSRSLFFHDIQPNVYYHVAAAYDGNGMRVYVNGQLKNSFPGFVPLLPGAGVAFSSPDTPLDGNLDDVRIYNRGLSQGEIASLSFNCANVSEIPQAECQALFDLYTSAGGPQWTNQTNWLLNTTPCSWYGVLCANGHVLALSLPNNGLHGPLPATLGNLSSAIVLSLYNNQLNGAIPPQLGNLSNLVTLDLFNNQLSGTLPAELGSLSKLQTLRLYSNQLRGTIPTQLANLTSLITLDLGYNALYTSDSALTQFLNTPQPNWASTQTVAPGHLHAVVQSPTSVALTWTPIPYTADGGYYEVLASKDGGQYTSVGKTADKTANSITITGLQSGAAYSFQVRTFTPKHSGQTNDVTSDPSNAVMATKANQPPVAANDSYATGQDTPLTIDAAHGLLANDSDPDGNPLQIGTISSVNPGSKFALNLDGSFTYTPAPGFVGTETFTYQATDGQALSNQATVAFTVNPKSNAATITIALDVQPDSATNFRFSGSLGSFLLDDITPSDGDAYSSSKTFSVAAGTYTVIEGVPGGWSNANISCNPPANTIADLTKNQIEINVASGANITCTFVTQHNGQLIGGAYNDHNHNHKQDRADQWLSGWAMQLRNESSAATANLTTNQNGRAPFTNLRPGNYTICETLQSGWFNITPGTTSGNAPCYSVTVAPGTAVWARFGNSTTPLAASLAGAAPFSDIVVCDLVATDDLGNSTTEERDPWEEEENAAAGKTQFMPLLVR